MYYSNYFKNQVKNIFLINCVWFLIGKTSGFTLTIEIFNIIFLLVSLPRFSHMLKFSLFLNKQNFDDLDDYNFVIFIFSFWDSHLILYIKNNFYLKFIQMKEDFSMASMFIGEDFYETSCESQW